MWNDLKRVARMPGPRRRLLWEALITLLITRGAMAFLPFRRIAAWLGTPSAESPVMVAADEIRMAQEVSWAVALSRDGCHGMGAVLLRRWLPWGCCAAAAWREL